MVFRTIPRKLVVEKANGTKGSGGKHRINKHREKAENILRKMASDEIPYSFPRIVIHFQMKSKGISKTYQYLNAHIPRSDFRKSLPLANQSKAVERGKSKTENTHTIKWKIVSCKRQEKKALSFSDFSEKRQFRYNEISWKIAVLCAYERREAERPRDAYTQSQQSIPSWRKLL